jgi:integrase
MAQEGFIRLFPDLNKSEKTAKLGKQPSKQFKAVVTAALGDVAGKSFHSLRHTFADFFKQKGLQNDYFRQVFGHELPTLAASQYGEKFPPELLYKEIILKLDYEIESQEMTYRVG